MVGEVQQVMHDSCLYRIKNVAHRVGVDRQGVNDILRSPAGSDTDCQTIVRQLIDRVITVLDDSKHATVAVHRADITRPVAQPLSCFPKLLAHATSQHEQALACTESAGRLSASRSTQVCKSLIS